VTTTGGIDSLGTMFKYDINSLQYSVVHQFDSTGGQPWEDLINASNGKLYGTTTVGGYANGGVAYSYNVLTNTYDKLFEFGTLECGYQGDLLETSKVPLEGIVSPFSNQGISLNPNPAQSVLTVTLSKSSEETTIEVFDLCGKTVYPPVSFHNNAVELNIETLPEGLYYLQITNKSGKPEARKFVKCE